MPTYSYEFGGKQVDCGDYGYEIVDTDTFDYEPSYSEVVEALEDVVKHDYGNQGCIEDFVEANFDQLCDEYEDYLKDYFEDQAREEYEDSQLLSKNPDAYYGVSRND